VRSGGDFTSTTATPVVTSVSQATRPLGSCFMTSSRTASRNLVGDFVRMAFGYDSDVNKNCVKASLKLILLRDLWGTVPQTHRSVQRLLNPTKLPSARGRNQRIDFQAAIRAANGRKWASNAISSIDWNTTKLRRSRRRAGCELPLRFFGHQVRTKKGSRFTVHDAVNIADLRILCDSP